MLLALLVLACAPSNDAPLLDAPAVEAPTARTALLDTLADTVAALGLPAEVILREAAPFAHEQGWTLLRVPAFPAPQQPFRILAVSDVVRDPPNSVNLFATTTSWASSVDVRGRQLTTADGRLLYLWGPVSLPAATVELAVRVEEPALTVWLSDGGANYTFPIAPPEPVTWVGDVVATLDLQTRNLPADPLFVGHDLTLWTSTYPQSSGASVIGRWSVDGVRQPDVEASLSAINVGQFGNDARWEVALPTADLSAGQQISAELVVRSAGPDLVEDNGGQRWTGTFAPAPPVAWWRAGLWGFSACHWDGFTCFTGWQWDPNLPDPLDASPGQFQAGASAPIPGVELYVPGVTDRFDYDPAALELIQVEVASPFFRGDPAAPSGTWPMRYRDRVGDNLRFEWPIRQQYHPLLLPNGVDCPAAGAYPYHFRASTDGGRSWSIIGNGPFPAANDSTLLWSNFYSTPALTTVPPGGGLTFPATPVGQVSQATLTLVNTSNVAITLRDLRWSAAQTEFSASYPGCPDVTACSPTLPSGAQLALQVRFRPAAAGARTIALLGERAAGGACVNTASEVLSFVGDGL